VKKNKKNKKNKIMSSPFQKSFIAKSPINMHEGKEHIDPDAPGTPNTPGYEPPVLRYKKGDLMNEDDASDHTDKNVQELSEIKKDERSQYMVTTDNDTIRPRFNSTKFFKSEIPKK
jgi:hypothetical protein